MEKVIHSNSKLPQFARFLRSRYGCGCGYHSVKELTKAFNKRCELFSQRQISSVYGLLLELEKLGYVISTESSPKLFRWKDIRIRPRISNLIFFDAKDKTLSE